MPFSLNCKNAFPRFFGGRIRLRGVTLAELAITLAVVGLLMGAALIPARMLEERRQLQEEIRRMEKVRDAVVGYALRHRTRARTVKFVILSESQDSRGDPAGRAQFGPYAFHLPGGRPYLPCPDWNGDGFEDRFPEGPNGFVQGLEVKPDLTVTLTLRSLRKTVYNRGNNLAYRHLFWARENNSNIPVNALPYGECVAARGAAPWRTLGIPPTDGWGSRHTYFADPMFANAVFGFDRQAVADIYDRRAPTAPGAFPAARSLYRADGFFADREIGSVTSNWDHQCPAAICDGSRSQNCWRHDYVGRPDAEFSYCTWGAPAAGLPPPEAAGRIFKAGAVNKLGIHPPSRGGGHFPPGAVNNGLPFVLVSHGPNGRFAVNHWATLRDPVDENGLQSPICNDESFSLSVEERGGMHEAINGTRLAPGTTSRPTLQPNQRCPQRSWRPRGGGVTQDGAYRNRFNPSFFVWEPPGSGDRSGFDDLLMWMTRDELAAAVKGPIPPLPRMSVPYAP